MIVRALSVALIVAALGACAPPSEEPPPGSPAVLVFAPLPDAFRTPNDDVDDGSDGLQVDVVINVDNVDNINNDVDSVTVSSTEGEGSADLVDGRATVRVTLDVGPAPAGVVNVLRATAGGFSVQRSVVGLDLRAPAPTIAATCVLSVDGAGAATVTCAGGDPLSGDAQSLLHGGRVVLATAAVNDEANARTRIGEMHGGAVQFPFAFDTGGDYVFAATLAGAVAVFGTAVLASANATVVVD